MPVIPFNSGPFVLVSAEFIARDKVLASFNYPIDLGLAGYTLTVGGVVQTINSQTLGSTVYETVLHTTQQPYNTPAILSISTAVTSSGNPATPGSINFSTLLGTISPVVSAGVANPTSETALRSVIPSVFKGPAWDALIAAIATGDEYQTQNTIGLFDQAFLATATGKYLTQIGSSMGVARPPIGMPDELYRALVVAMNAEKLTINSILRILEIFFGPQATRVHITSSTVGPYIISDGEVVAFSFEGKPPIRVTFFDRDFGDLTAATAEEVAAVINREFAQSNSNAFVDVRTDGFFVVYSGTKGIKGKILVATDSTPFGAEFTQGYVVASQTYTYSSTVTVTQFQEILNITVPPTSPAIDRTMAAGGYLTSISPYLAPETFTVTSTPVATTSALNSGVRLGVTLATPLDWPMDSEFYVIIGLGFSYQVGPVKCIAGAGNTITFSAPQFIAKNVPVGASVNLVSTNTEAIVPAFYLTDSASGRREAELTLDRIVAVGNDYKVTIIYPSDRGLGNEGRGSQSDIVKVYQ
jgi:hypothetical protein